MDLRFQFDTNNIDWEKVIDILRSNGMGFRDADTHKRAFEKSYSVVFVFDNDLLIGIGRAISDGEYQAAVYDVAVLPQYQGMGVGKTIVDKIVDKTPNCNFILYASPGKEPFYEKLNFRKMKTGMGKFLNEQRMIEKGFVE